MLKLSKSFNLFFAGIVLIYMVHAPCICSIVYTAQVKQECAAQQGTCETPMHCCCCKTSTTEKTEPIKKSTDTCPYAGSCSNWFLYLKTADFDFSDQIHTTSAPLLVAAPFMYDSDQSFTLTQARAYWLLHPPDIAPQTTRSTILRI